MANNIKWEEGPFPDKEVMHLMREIPISGKMLFFATVEWSEKRRKKMLGKNYKKKNRYMNYYLDTEFIEGPQEKRLFGIKYGMTKPTIDLISIGIVGDDGREYYAISKDFNIDEAWNRFQEKEQPKIDSINIFSNYKKGEDPYKEYWIRENVLWPIYKELKNKYLQDNPYHKNQDPYSRNQNYVVGDPFDIGNLNSLIQQYGKTNNQITEEVIKFCSCAAINKESNSLWFTHRTDPIFYAYYADYDWVVFCQLFGTMMDLPKGFPMYCQDLKQILDEKKRQKRNFADCPEVVTLNNHNLICDINLKKHKCYPKQENEHNALADARWNKKLHEFLKQL